MYDVIIVGAGPGGASAAYFLGEAGQRVLVLEKETLPRYKTCGGGISTRMLNKYFPFSFEPVIETKVKAISYALGRTSITIPLPDRSMGMVMRDRFDAYILAHARAEVRQGVSVRGVTEIADRVIVETGDGQTFEARYLIGADGASSVVARSLGLRRGKTLVAAIEAEAPVSPEVLRRFAETPLFIFGEIRLGYLWIFPKSDHLSVGIATFHPKHGQLQTTLSRVMARYNISLEGVPLRGHPIPVHTRREPITTARTLLVGDAAGVVDPLSGEGIRLAIKSGQLAAKTIQMQRLDLYPGLVYQHIGLGQSLALALDSVFYYLPKLCFMLGMRNPLATQAFMDLLSDRADYPEVIARVIGGLPIYLLTESVAALASLFGGPGRRRQIRSTVYGHTGD